MVPTAEGITFRQLIQIFHTIQKPSYTHTPESHPQRSETENIMVGDFVRSIVDWGIAKIMG